MSHDGHMGIACLHGRLMTASRQRAQIATLPCLADNGRERVALAFDLFQDRGRLRLLDQETFVRLSRVGLEFLNTRYPSLFLDLVPFNNGVADLPEQPFTGGKPAQDTPIAPFGISTFKQ